MFKALRKSLSNVRGRFKRGVEEEAEETDIPDEPEQKKPVKESKKVVKNEQPKKEPVKLKQKPKKRPAEPKKREKKDGNPNHTLLHDQKKYSSVWDPFIHTILSPTKYVTFYEKNITLFLLEQDVKLQEFVNISITF